MPIVSRSRSGDKAMGVRSILPCSSNTWTTARYRAVERVGVAFARRGADDVAFGIDQDLRRPRARAVRTPDLESLVVDDRMIDVVAHENPPQVLALPLVRELRGMHTDDDQLSAVLLLEALEVRNDVQAVDAAVRPEIEQDDFAAKRLQRQGRRDVEPVEAGGEIGGVNAGGSVGHEELGYWSAAPALMTTRIFRVLRMSSSGFASSSKMSAALPGSSVPRVASVPTARAALRVAACSAWRRRQSRAESRAARARGGSSAADRGGPSGRRCRRRSRRRARSRAS